MEMLAHALQYVARGWPVFPVDVHKKPLTRHGFKDATIDPEQVRALWRSYPDAGIGIPTGYGSGIWVLDVDGEEGRASLTTLEAERGALPSTLRSQTGRGGSHIFFSMPEGVDIRNSASSRFGKGIDVRGNGGYIVAPPSAHYAGTRYVWTCEDPIAAAPEDIVRMALGTSAPPEKKVILAPRAYAMKVLADECRRVANAPEGTRNDALNKAAFAVARFVVQGVLQAGETQRALKDAAYGAGLPLVEAERTIRSAFEARQVAATEARDEAVNDPEAAVDVRALLDRKANGAPIASENNALIILSKDSRWRDVIAADVFAKKIVTKKQPPWGDTLCASVPWREGQQWEDEDDARLLAWMDREYRIRLPIAAVQRSVNLHAHSHAIHPVRDYLDALIWDGKPRLDSWLTSYLGVRPSVYSSRVGAMWLLSAVARIYRPGCQADYVLILEGAQGIGKSTVIAALFGAQWFSDSLPEIGSKDAYVGLLGKWVIEIAELDVFGRAESSSAKKFFSARTDTFRSPFDRRSKDQGRSCVFFGSTNQDEYLRDATGNRRYWPVACTEIDREGVARARDQLWAEARVRFERGEQWWPDAHFQGLATDEQHTRMESDPWDDIITTYVTDRVGPLRTWTVADHALGLTVDKVGRREQMRIAAILRKNGYERTTARINGVTTKVFIRKEVDATVTA